MRGSNSINTPTSMSVYSQCSFEIKMVASLCFILGLRGYRVGVRAKVRAMYFGQEWAKKHFGAMFRSAWAEGVVVKAHGTKKKRKWECTFDADGENDVILQCKLRLV